MFRHISILGAMIALLGGLSLFIGVEDVTPLSLWRQEDAALTIFFVSRVPRLMAILCTGIGLSAAGAIMQRVMSNNFVAPSTGSTMDWAKLGVLVAIFFFPSANTGIKMLVSAGFAFGGSMLFTGLLRAMRLKDPLFIPLVGIMLGSVVNAVTTSIAYRYDLVQNIASWLQGNFAMILRGRYELLYAGIPLLILASLFADRFTIASMGEDFSINLGVNYTITVTVGILIASLIASVVLVTVGNVPFVGVIVPNITRLFRGDNLKNSLGEIALTGGLFILICDIVSRLVIFPFEVPIGVTAGVMGSAMFLYLLLGSRRYGKPA